MDQSLKDLLIGLEQELLLPDVRRNKERLNELLADDFLEFGQSGAAYVKADTLNSLPDLSPEVFFTSDFQVKELAGDTMLLTYILERQGSETEKSRSRRSSIWQKRGDRWQLVFHHGTRCAL